MISFIRKLFGLCIHEISIEVRRLIITHNDDTKSTGSRHIITCKKCGMVKYKDII